MTVQNSLTTAGLSNEKSIEVACRAALVLNEGT